MEKIRQEKPSEKTQQERFIETARALGCDEDESAFFDKLGKIARVKVEPTRKPGAK